MKTRHIFLVVLVAGLCGCSSTSVVTDNVTPGLRATLYPDGQTFRTNIAAELRCAIRNVSGSPVQVDTFSLGSAILSLAVFDASGKRIPTVPPPMPPHPDHADEFLKVLRPGQTITESYSLYMFSPPLKPGTYTVRMSDIDSNKVIFKIEEAMGN